jgi:CYTH domain-containing protein
MHVKLELEMEDSTHKMLVKWGKEVASDEDYINIAISAGLKHYIHRTDATH